jgi:hypothetical protein
MATKSRDVALSSKRPVTSVPFNTNLIFTTIPCSRFDWPTHVAVLQDRPATGTWGTVAELLQLG